MLPQLQRPPSLCQIKHEEHTRIYSISDFMSWCNFSSQLVVLVVLAGAAQAVPGGGYGKPKCRTEYETSYTTSYEEKCSTSYEQECSTSYEEQCSTSYEQECSTAYETSYEKSCSTTYEKVKESVFWQLTLAFCFQVCSSGGYGGYHKRDAEPGYGKREARRSYGHSAPRKSSCKRVPKQSCQSKPVQKPVKKCESVPKKSCSQVPKESCKSVPKESCRSVPVQKPTKVAKQVCSGGGSSHRSGGYGGYRGWKAISCTCRSKDLVAKYSSQPKLFFLGLLKFISINFSTRYWSLEFGKHGQMGYW